MLEECKMGALRKEEVSNEDADDQLLEDKRYQEPTSILISDEWDTTLEEYMNVYEDFVGDDLSNGDV
jgi:hypothetical protein